MKVHKRFTLSIEHLWALTVMVGVFVFVNTHPIRPQDYWWHMAVGREIVNTGQIPTIDTYSYTMLGQPYPSYQMYWLMEGAMFLVYQAGGGALTIFLHGLAITTSYGIILWLSFQRSRNWRIAAFSLLFAAALGMNDWNIRPQAITFLLGSVILLAIYKIRHKQSRVWLVIFPLGLAVWSNSHGSFVIGLVLIGAWWLEEAWQAFHRKEGGIVRLVPPTISGISAGLACFLNPQGFAIVKYIHGMAGSTVVQNFVPEWAPPTFETLGGAIFLVSFIASVCVLILSPRRPSVSQMILFVVFSFLGLRTIRGSIWYGIVMAPILAEHLSAIVLSRIQAHPLHVESRGSSKLTLSMAIGLLLMAAVSLPWFKQYLPLPPIKAGLFSYETPIDATEYLLEEQLPGPLFHSMSFGSYLIWEAQPDYPVFVDPRIDLFDQNIIIEYILASSAEGDWQGFLEKYAIQTIMASPDEQGGLIDALQSAPNWKRVYSDNAAVIFTRKK